jgi:hypothetical protein
MRYLLFLLALAGCPQEPPPACTMVDTTCTNLAYMPTFDNVYKNTIKVSCGVDDNSCHSTAGHQGGLSFQEGEMPAYTALMQSSGLDPSRKRVVPGDPACSLMIVRTEGVGKDYQMPKGDPLTPEARCALVQWVEAGAMMGSAMGSAQ